MTDCRYQVLVTCKQVLTSKLSTNANFQKFARFKFRDFSRIFKYFQAPYLFSSTFKGLEVFIPKSSIFKDLSSTLWTLHRKCGLWCPPPRGKGSRVHVLMPQSHAVENQIVSCTDKRTWLCLKLSLRLSIMSSTGLNVTLLLYWGYCWPESWQVLGGGDIAGPVHTGDGHRGTSPR